MMKQVIKKTVALVLCLILALSTGMVAFAAADTDKRTTCGEDCEFYPTIIIPGLGQSSVWVLDENDDFVLDDEGKKVSSFPAYVQIPEIIKKVAVPLLLSLGLQRDVGLSKAVADAIEICFGLNASDSDGNVVGNVMVEKYPYSLAECNEEERATVYSHVPLNKYESDLPEDHLYYFTYNSFGNVLQLADELYAYIQMVKAQTGHDKVNLVPLSQGGTLTSAMLDTRDDIAKELHKVIFVVPALDGSTIIGDVFNDRVSFLNPDYLYNGFLAGLGLLDEETARMIEVLLRILPDEVLVKCLEAAVERLVGSVMTTSTNLWALCPSGDYPTAAAKYLASPEMAKIKEQTDRYYQAQLDCDNNILGLIEDGVQVFCIAEYDVNMINVGTTWNTQNADFIIHLDSTSMGAYAANVGETLPADYVQKNTNCTTPGHNHISPDRVVDASAGLLPDTTFYFDGQRHDLTAHNDVILKLALELIAYDTVTDVYTSPAFPQFNIGRDPENLSDLVEQAKAVDLTALSAEDAAEIKAAIAEAEEIINKTVGVAGEIENSEKRLTDCLVKAGAIAAEKEKFSLPIFSKLSPWIYEKCGTNGFSEIAMDVLKTIFGFLKNLFTEAEPAA